MATIPAHLVEKALEAIEKFCNTRDIELGEEQRTLFANAWQEGTIHEWCPKSDIISRIKTTPHAQQQQGLFVVVYGASSTIDARLTQGLNALIRRLTQGQWFES